jgi:hypothetical protein
MGIEQQQLVCLVMVMYLGHVLTQLVMVMVMLALGLC